MIVPILDRILLRKLPEKQTGLIKKPDAYYESERFEVVALGNFVILGGQRFDISEFLKVGDVIRVHRYDYEDIEVDGEKFQLTRIQNVHGKEKAKVAKSRAA